MFVFGGVLGKKVTAALTCSIPSTGLNTRKSNVLAGYSVVYGRRKLTNRAAARRRHALREASHRGRTG
jgi:hypothetical protein